MGLAERPDTLRLPAFWKPTRHFNGGERSILSGFDQRFSIFLTGSDPQTEIDVTPSKQSTGEFLTGARTSISRSAQVHDPELLQAKEKRNSSTLNSAIMVTLCP